MQMILWQVICWEYQW